MSDKLTRCPGDTSAQPSYAGCHLLLSAPAQFLYVALSGHRFGTPPAAASVLVAKQVRARLQWLQVNPGYVPLYRDTVEMFNLANRVIACWGEYIQPWLGMMKVDANNRPILYHPCYDQRLYFDAPGTIWPVA